MLLELHDDEVGNSLTAVTRSIDYMYQAEQWVIESTTDHPFVVEWRLFTDTGSPIRAWKRNPSTNQVEDSPSGALVADPRSLRPRQDGR